MQQFFIDLGTGTTVDNLYNITGLTHNIAPGKFTTEMKFTFADAYGKYESSQSFITGVASKMSYWSAQIQNQVQKNEKKPGKK
jgi:hypothetical protein